MIDFFKKNFVFGIGVLQAIIVVSCIFIGNKKLFLIATEYSKYLGIFIFIVWLKDDNYKFLYYLGFFLSSSFMGFIISELIRPFSMNIINGRVSLVVFLIFVFLLTSTVGQFLYNVFRNMSYKKYKNDL